MAALNFPANQANQSPVNTFSPTSTPSATTNGATYIWDGNSWTGFVEGTAQYWLRAGSVLSPLNAGDSVTIGGSNNISLFADGSIDAAGNINYNNYDQSDNNSGGYSVQGYCIYGG